MHDEIAEVLRLPESGRGAPTLARLEDVLTEGYALALALDAERWRIERRIGEVARVAGDPAANGLAQELASLSERLTSADGELSDLRALLGSLRDRTRAARAATCA